MYAAGTVAQASAAGSPSSVRSAAAPRAAPASCASASQAARRRDMRPHTSAASVTVGFICAPDTCARHCAPTRVRCHFIRL